MFNALQKNMIGNAALLLFVAMCAGIGLLMCLVGGMELFPGKIADIGVPGHAGAWARTHVGGILNALLMLAVALILPGLGFTKRSAARVGWIFIGTGWANTLFYWAALFAPNRALTFGANQFGESNLASALGLAPGLLFAILSLIAVATIARQAFGKASGEAPQDLHSAR
jgi:hypothetical protein